MILRKSSLFFIIMPVVAFGIFALASFADRNAAVPYYGSNRVSYKDPGEAAISPVSPFAFVNQDGKIINETYIKDRIWIADFFFTSCKTICPAMSNNLKKVQQEAAAKGVRIVSFSCDPETDDPDRLKQYSLIYNADPSAWQFVTGDKKELYAFARKQLQVVATDGDGGPDDFIHSESFVLIDRAGYIRGYYDGTDGSETERLLKDIDKLIK